MVTVVVIVMTIVMVIVMLVVVKVQTLENSSVVPLSAFVATATVELRTSTAENQHTPPSPQHDATRCHKRQNEGRGVEGTLCATERGLHSRPSSKELLVPLKPAHALVYQLLEHDYAPPQMNAAPNAKRPEQ